MQSINIDKVVNETDIQHSNSTTITTSDMIHFISSSKGQVVTNNDENDDHSVPLNIIQIMFTIPYNISNESILNKTVFITDIRHNQLLASLTNICVNESSFFINYSTIQPLPHTICLYLLLNLTSSLTLREIIFCHTIEDLYNHTSSSNDTGPDTHSTVGPSGFFILSQCIIILVMMFIIYGVETARQKSLVNRVSQRLFRSRLYITIFGNKTVVPTRSNTIHVPINPAATLEVGLNLITFNRHLTSLPNHQIITPIEEQVLAASDLTSTMNDRRATRPRISRGLIDVKEFTKRMSVAHETSTDAELHSL